MNPLEKQDLTMGELFEYYFHRIDEEDKNVNRIKKFYTDDDTFNVLMDRVIEKDYKRFDKMIKLEILPNPWRVLYVILEIVQREGKEVEPFDVLTKSYPSRTLSFRGWTFSWVHGESTLISIYNRLDELVYRF